MTARLLLMPGLPMLVQGQELAASTPCRYVADDGPDLAEAVRDGRREFLSQFPNLASSEMAARLADPGDAETFRRCILDLDERRTHEPAYALHRDLLELRRSDRILGKRPARVDGAELGEGAWLLRFFCDPGDCLLLVNMGADLTLAPMPEPLLAPLADQAWQIRWSSESPRYGGGGVPALYRSGSLHLPGESATVLMPGPLTPDAAPELEKKEMRIRSHGDG
jgi:maltooligosyltrehalose trehalohydrolase